ncbi:MAG: 30S ribosomal protein S9 [bacterium]|nr:30S ribosomal protein S9 [bacterium]
MSKDYFEGIGRRKRAVARVRVFTCGPNESIEAGNFSINNKNYKEYFPTLSLQRTVEDPFTKLKSLNRFTGTVKIYGGGINAQAEAVRHGTSRALILFDINFRKKLKKSGFLRRDPREVERKKFGLKKARRAPQWSKR